MHKSKRQSNFELLRIVAMFMVMVLHFLVRTGLLPEAGDSLGSASVGAVIAESFCIVAVNVYVLISGYFLSAAEFSWKRIVTLAAQVLFYTLLIPVVLAVLGVIPVSQLTDVYHLWNCLFPIQGGHYWFVSAYVVMCLFSPFINAAVWQLEPKRFAQILAGLLLLFSVGKTLSPLRFATDRFGYDFGWLLCVYLIGAWIRRFGFRYLNSLAKGAGLYLSCVTVTAGLELVLLYLAQTTSALHHYASVPFHYNFLPCIAAAVGLFAVFFHMHIPEGRADKLIRFAAPAVFGVYLIHEHVDISANWCGWMTALTGLQGPLILIPAFIACLLIDKLRGALFAAAAGLIRKRGGCR